MLSKITANVKILHSKYFQTNMESLSFMFTYSKWTPGVRQKLGEMPEALLVDGKNEYIGKSK